MPTRRSTGDIVLFSSADPQQLVQWLCDRYGQIAILQAVAQYRPSGAAGGGGQRAAKKRGPRRGSKRRAAKKGPRVASGKKGGKNGRRKAGSGGGDAAGDG